ncbi:MAG: DUF1513 domain-containing protein [Pontibacterium sp.]
MQRRDALKSLLGLGVGMASLSATGISPLAMAQASPTAITDLSEHQPLLASAMTSKTGEHSLTLVNADGSLGLQATLPTRAHHVAKHPIHPQVAVVARRPGTFVQVYNYETQALIADIHAQPEHHFFGHGIYSPSGELLYVTENNLKTDQSALAVYETQTYSRVNTFPTRGIGAHELVWAGDGVIAVANGGILTRPEQGRKKLNLDTMQPSLTYLDAQSGQVLEQVFLPEHLHKLSIRHIAYSPKHGVVIGMQYQGDMTDAVPLVAIHQRGKGIEFMDVMQGAYLNFRQYCGSVRVDTSGEIAAISSPVGGIVSFWRLADRQLLAVKKARDGCGLCATQQAGEFLVTSGSGWVKRFRAPEFKAERTFAGSRFDKWDNHLMWLA